MFEIMKAIVLGVVQGATEFIPVSSSGHLVIVPWLLGWEPSTLLFDAILHWGTLLSLLIVFGQDFWNMLLAVLRSIRTRSLDADARLAWLIVLGSIPAAVFGYLVKDALEALFLGASAPLVAGFSLLVTALLLATSEFLTAKSVNFRSLDELKVRDSVAIGLAQVLALLPGVSRSGSTIAAGLVCGLRRETAARFSFLLGAPVFFGAGLLELTDTVLEEQAQFIADLPVLLIGFAVSAITGFLAIRFLLAYLRENSLYIFAAYCLVAGCIVLALNFSGIL